MKEEVYIRQLFLIVHGNLEIMLQPRESEMCQLKSSCPHFTFFRLSVLVYLIKVRDADPVAVISSISFDGYK